VRPAYSVLYSFKGGTGDGAYPSASLLNVNGKLYGTTTKGGTGSCSNYSGPGCGTVFSITTSGNETMLYSFKGGSGDGYYPEAGLINVKGTLYGTTSDGGRCQGVQDGCGTVFSASTSGQESVLYRFKRFRKGDQPFAGLTVSNGLLYGTTYEGGSGCGGDGCGTAFTVTTGGKYRLLHNFGRDFGHKNAPYNPWAGLTLSNGALYGTTVVGGASALGTVFELSAAGKVHVLHSFGSGGGGNLPIGGVTVLGGKLYGTADDGGTGTGCYGTGGCGVVYSVTTNGQENLLYSFNYGDGDGSFPQASLTVFKGTLYGTTSSGGTACGASQGCGTVFSVTTAGQETVLHNFTGGSDGASPVAGLIVFHGTLYGTTSAGGTNGDGTVFSISP
jgi:uncharacterized repeat protein (TIGR03803 family)